VGKKLIRDDATDDLSFFLRNHKGGRIVQRLLKEMIAALRKNWKEVLSLYGNPFDLLDYGKKEEGRRQPWESGKFWKRKKRLKKGCVS